jgi:co-chaperonin GroES (HSP10)
MIVADTFTPRGEYHFVRFTKVPEQTDSGIWLPDSVRENYCEAEILSSGTGAYLADWRSVMWACESQVVIFQKHSFIPLAAQEEGLIKDSDIVAIEAYSGVIPINDWIRIRRIGKKEYSGNIAIPDEWQTSEPMGIVEKWGPGKLVKVGELAGHRIPIHDILGLSCERVLKGCMVRWGKTATVLEVTKDNNCRTFVRAQDLDCIVCED